MWLARLDLAEPGRPIQFLYDTDLAAADYVKRKALLALTLFRLRILRVFLHHWPSFLEQIHFCKREQDAWWLVKPTDRSAASQPESSDYSAFQPIHR